MIIVGTLKTGIDQSKASSVFIHGLLNIQKICSLGRNKRSMLWCWPLEFARNHIVSKARCLCLSNS